eukprot:scaffold35254_cov63-Phaeocystis_antarctica.AAC.3
MHSLPTVGSRACVFCLGRNGGPVGEGQGRCEAIGYTAAAAARGAHCRCEGREGGGGELVGAGSG